MMVFEISGPRDQFKFRSDLIILFVCLLLSVAAWLRVSYFRNKEFKATVPLQFVIPDSLKMINQVPQSVNLFLEMESAEWFKLKNRLSQKPLEIMLSDSPEQYFTREFLTQQFRASFPEFEIKKLDILIDEDIYVQLTRSEFKKVPVEDKTVVSFYPGYDFVDSIRIEPDSITVFGPKSLLDSINSWPTEIVLLERIKENISKLIKLESPKDKQIGLSHQYVEFTLNIGEFTEKELNIPIQIFSGKNGNEKFRIFPAIAKVYVKTPIDKYNELTASDIQIGVSLNKTPDKNNLITIEVVSAPDYLKNIKIYPKFVEVYKYE